MKKMMRMQLFGKLCLTDQQITMDEDSLHSNKLVRLLAYVIIHRKSVLSQQRLIDIFWEDDESVKNPAGALKNLMYRLRSVLRVFGDEEFICTMPGAYQWNPEIRVETDYEEFERMALAVRGQSDSEKKREMCERTVFLYNGNISPKLAGETWILPKLTWYQSLYMDTVKELCGIYEKEEKWELLESLCTDACAVDTLDEDIHCWMLKSLAGQKKYKLVRTHYEKAEGMIYDLLGVHVSEKLQSVFLASLEGREKKETNIGRLLNEVCEEEKPEGAFFCEYPVFRQIYRVEARRLSRMGLAEYVLLLTLRQRDMENQEAVSPRLLEGMNVLGSLLSRSLRIGDVASRYNAFQYIVLLPTCTYEAGMMVAQRIQQEFQKEIGRKRLELMYELEELSNAE